MVAPRAAICMHRRMSNCHNDHHLATGVRGTVEPKHHDTYLKCGKFLTFLELPDKTFLNKYIRKYFANFERNFRQI